MQVRPAPLTAECVSGSRPHKSAQLMEDSTMSSANSISVEEEQSRRVYRAVWRWHFYAGIFCIPLVIWLACTGSIYLFKPQIERWLDRPYDHLALHGPQATPEAVANAAMDAVPGSSL